VIEKHCPTLLHIHYRDRGHILINDDDHNKLYNRIRKMRSLAVLGIMWNRMIWNHGLKSNTKISDFF